MKKVAVLVSIFTFVFLTLFIIIDQAEQKLNIVYVDRLAEEAGSTVKVCVKRSDGKLVLIDTCKHKQEDNYLYILKLYDHYRNALPPSYVTPLQGNFEIIKLEKTENKLNIELKAMYLKSGFKEFLTAFMWSYQYMGIDSINMKINKEIFYLEKNTLINPEIDSYSAYDNIIQIVFYKEGDDIIPVSYYHQENRIDFLMNKVISKFPDVTYTYQIQDDMLTIRISDPDYQLSKEITDMLLLSIKHLNLYRNIIIIKNDVVVANN
ncbi:MAG: hypothetical protein PHT03_03165 [Bacilli bacterium]|nr:hypothetical protein [Bacilli bacterium]